MSETDKYLTKFEVIGARQSQVVGNLQLPYFFTNAFLLCLCSK